MVLISSPISSTSFLFSKKQWPFLSVTYCNCLNTQTDSLLFYESTHCESMRTWVKIPITHMKTGCGSAHLYPGIWDMETGVSEGSEQAGLCELLSGKQNKMRSLQKSGCSWALFSFLYLSFLFSSLGLLKHLLHGSTLSYF